MKTSEKINEIATALASFQKNVPTISKNKTAKVTMKSGGSYTYKYADIADVLQSIRSHLSDSGLSVSQFPENENVLVNNIVQEYVIVTTKIMHTSGQWIESSIKGSLAANQGTMSNMQGIGSVTTYLRRYSLASMLGLATDDDVDGNISGDGQSNVEAEIESYRSATANFLPFINNIDIKTWIESYLKNNRGLEQAKKAHRIAVNENKCCVLMVEIDNKINQLLSVGYDEAQKYNKKLYDINSSRLRFVEEEGKCLSYLEKLQATVDGIINSLESGNA
jgi:hypothetical protein